MISDPIFWAVIAVSCPLYWLCPERFRAALLGVIGGSVILYYDATSFLFLSVLSALVYLSLPIVADGASRRALIAASILVALLVAPLILFKSGVLIDIARAERPLAAAEVIVPLGMSYYVFRLVHVIIDTYRHESVLVDRSQFVKYVFLFTIIPAGPIQRIQPFVQDEAARLTQDDILHAAFRIASGFVKQVVLLGMLFDMRARLVGGAPVSLDLLETASYPNLWLVLVMGYIGALLNLSAYTDIAIGTSRLYGFKIGENFNFPFIATSLPDFWRRWHITLSSWCQSYVYTPVLGATRNPYLALIVSFQVMGLWHVLSLNRVAWGIMQAAGVIVVASVQRLNRRHKLTWSSTPLGTAASWLFTQAFISASWIFVISENSDSIVRPLLVLARLVTG